MADDKPSLPPDLTPKQSQLRIHGDRVLDADIFGRSQILERLFRFLLDCALEGRSPKELEIADQVFGRSIGRADQDTSVRAYVHRLRRKLDDYYNGPAADEAIRLVIPKGAYRLDVEQKPDSTPPEPKALVSPLNGWSDYRLLLAFAIAILVTAAVTALLLWPSASLPRQVMAARDSVLWRPFSHDRRQLIFVVGDYYIFGNRDEDGDITRLIREFDVNSPKDLQKRQAADPVQAGQYADLGLSYLPIGVSNALRLTIPVAGQFERSAVVPASQLTPAMLKNANIVYLGYISGLAALRDPTFSGSRYAVGTSYDEIIDRTTGRHYMAGTHLDQDNNVPTQDYALISSFPGVAGNHILVIAGTRDAALMGAVEFVTKPETIKALTERSGNGLAFDALLKIESMNAIGLGADIVSQGQRDSSIPWRGGRPQSFPDSSLSQ